MPPPGLSTWKRLLAHKTACLRSLTPIPHSGCLPLVPQALAQPSGSILLPPWTDLGKSSWSLSDVWHVQGPRLTLRVDGQPSACRTQPVDQQWWRWGPDTTYACGPQIQFWELSSQTILAFKSTFPGRNFGCLQWLYHFSFSKENSSSSLTKRSWQIFKNKIN